MSIQLPKEHDLVAALGEPRLADPGVPWAYNRLTFEVARDRDRVEVTVSPGYGEVLIGWQRDGEVLVTLQLGNVAALAVEREHEREYLVARFPDTREVRPLRVQLSPAVSVFWGTGPYGPLHKP